jgi:hypothetical protein
MSDFWSGVIVALVVSVVANLITPMTRAAFIGAAIRIGNAARALGSWGLHRSLLNSEKELRTLDEYHADPARFSAIAFDIVSWNVMLLWVLAVALMIAVFGGWVPSRMATSGFFGLLGASTSTLGRLLVLQLLADRLRTYDRYRPDLVRRIDTVRATINEQPSED